MSDNNLNKNTALELNFGSKDENTVKGVQAKKIKKLDIDLTHIVQNINSNPVGLEILLADIINRLDKLEKNNIKNTNVKKNKYRNYVPLHLRTKDIEPEVLKIIKDNQNYVKIEYNPEILRQYQFLGLNQLVPGTRPMKMLIEPNCVIFVHKDFYPQFKKLIEHIKDFNYY